MNQEKKKNQNQKALEGFKGMTGLISGMLGMGLVTMAGGQMMKMFGDNNEKIPKGVVKELMEGAMAGIIEHFNNKVNELEYDLKEAQQMVGEQQQQIDDHKQMIVNQEGVIETLNKELDKERAKQNGKNKHQRKR